MEPESSYYRAALANQYNIILLAGSASFSAALASWTPLLSGLVGEVLWLAAGPRWGAFRRRTDQRREREELSRALAALGTEYGPEVQALRAELTDIERACAARPDLTPEQRAEVGRRLAPLLRAFLESCGAHQRLRRVSARATLAELQAEVATVQRSLATEADLGVRASLRRALTVAERRIKQLEGNETACRSIELALQIMRKSVVYIKEQAAGLGSAADICGELDAAAAQLTLAAPLDPERDGEVQERASVLPPAHAS